jgi:hypothetical protein
MERLPRKIKKIIKGSYFYEYDSGRFVGYIRLYIPKYRHPYTRKINLYGKKILDAYIKGMFDF